MTKRTKGGSRYQKASAPDSRVTGSNPWDQLGPVGSEIPTEPTAAALIYGVLLQRMRFNYRQHCIFLDFVEDRTALLELLVATATAAAGTAAAEHVRNVVCQINDFCRSERRLHELEQFHIVFEKEGGFRDDLERREACRGYFCEADAVIDNLRELCACEDATRERLIRLGELLADAVYRSDLEEYVISDRLEMASHQTGEDANQAETFRSAQQQRSQYPLGWQSIRCAEAPAPNNWLDLVRIEWRRAFGDDRGRPREVPSFLIEPTGLAGEEIAVKRVAFLNDVLNTAVGRLSATANALGLAVVVIDSKVYLIRNANGKKHKIEIGKGAERALAEELIQAGEDGRSRTELEDLMNLLPAEGEDADKRKKAFENALRRLRERGLGKLRIEIAADRASESGPCRYRFAPMRGKRRGSTRSGRPT